MHVNGVNREWLRSLPAAVPAVLVALVVVLAAAPQQGGLETVLELALCLAAGHASLFPRAALTVCLVLLALLLLVPSSDASLVGFLCLVPIGCAIVMRPLVEAAVESVLFLVVVGMHTLAGGVDGSAAESLRNFSSWLALLVCGWLLALVVRNQRSANAALSAQLGDIVGQNNERLARRLHDTVAQSNARIALTAENARLALEGGDEEVTHAGLGMIVDEAERNARDLRLLLEQLGDAGAGHQDLGEQPMDLGQVINQQAAVLRRFGLTLEAVVDDSAGPAVLPAPAIGLANAVVNEVCTNMLKYSRPGPCRLLITIEATVIDLVAVNVIAPRTLEGVTHGRGLGMLRSALEREQGRLESGPDEKGLNWIVRAVIPMEEVPGA